MQNINKHVLDLNMLKFLNRALYIYLCKSGHKVHNVSIHFHVYHIFVIADLVRRVKISNTSCFLIYQNLQINLVKFSDIWTLVLQKKCGDVYKRGGIGINIVGALPLRQ